jgi:hypothetical protein
MKHLKQLPPLFICLLAIGCATTGGVSHDPVVLAEHAIVDGKATFDTFVHLEAINRDVLLKVNPKIHSYAEYIRKNAPIWLGQAYAMTQAYKTNSSETNLVNLKAITATINEAITQSNTYVGTINSTVKSP